VTPLAPHDDPGPEVGATGARFGGGGRRRGRRSPEEAPTLAIPVVPPVVPGEPAIGLTGARFGGPSRRRRQAAVVVEEPFEAVAAAWITSGGTTAAVPAEVPSLVPRETEDPDPASSFVRPYVLTRGRTRSELELAIETLLSAVPGAAVSQHPDIVELCREPRSVAEVAALHGLPLGWPGSSWGISRPSARSSCTAPWTRAAPISR